MEVMTATEAALLERDYVHRFAAQPLALSLSGQVVMARAVSHVVQEGDTLHANQHL